MSDRVGDFSRIMQTSTNWPVSNSVTSQNQNTLDNSTREVTPRKAITLTQRRNNAEAMNQALTNRD